MTSAKVDHPETTTLPVDARLPLLLLPVRIETRLRRTVNPEPHGSSDRFKSTLLVRIYPDDIHLDLQGDGLTEAEITAGKGYWFRRFNSPAHAVGEPWRDLVAELGPRRAGWVASVLTPTNSPPLIRKFGFVAEPDFPSVTPRDPGRWVRAALLPDRFYVIVSLFFETTVVTGTTPSGGLAVVERTRYRNTESPPEGGNFGRAVQALAGVDAASTDPEVRWLTDFAAAERAGMAASVELPDGITNIEQVSVVGVRDQALGDGAAEVARLLAKHAYSDGFGFPRTGSVTNNTPSSRTAWSARATPEEPPMPREPRAEERSRPHHPPHGIGIVGGEGEGEGPIIFWPPPDTTEDETDPTVRARTPAVALAEALGCDPALLAPLDDPDRPEQDWAQAFMRVLWPVTWGAMLDRMLAPTLTGSKLPITARNAARDHAVDFVRGRGPLPTVRVGKQPYGVLPVTSHDKHQWVADPGDPVDGGLFTALPGLRQMWLKGTNELRTVFRGDLENDLPLMLGMQPTMLGLRVRHVLSGYVAAHVVNPDLDEPLKVKISRQLRDELAPRVGAHRDDFVLPDAVEDAQRILAKPLAAESDQKFCQTLLTNSRVRRVDSILQGLVGYAVSSARHEVEGYAVRANILRDAVTRRHGDLPDQVERGIAALEARNFEHARLFTLVADEAERQFPWPPAPILSDRPNVPFDPAAYAKAARGIHPVDAAAQNIFDPKFGAYQGLNAAMRAAERMAMLLKATRVIASIEDKADRALLLAETLDCASHRLDAWLTSQATRRLDRIREARPTGIGVGAYGWVESIAIDANASPVSGDHPTIEVERDGGFIAAPSPAHAATAGVLRGASLTHDPDNRGDGPLAIDLSSARVREALTVLDGIRAGQSLGALLGYRIERWLHEDSRGPLDRFIYVLRSIAPLVAAKLTDPARGAVADPALESVSATEVVDGVRLLELYHKEDSHRTVSEALGKAPTDYGHYLADTLWPDIPNMSLDKAIKAVLDNIARLDALLDAVADLLLSESVHQLLQGSPARAAAAADVLNGDGAPPQLEVTANPAEGIPITHRLVVMLPKSAARLSNWSDSPRSELHPELEAWAQTVLGDADRIALNTERTVTLAASGIAALDLVVAAREGTDNDRRFWELLARRTPGLAGAVFPEPAPLDGSAGGVSTFAAAWAIATSARRLLTGARGAVPADLQRPSDVGRRQPARAVDFSVLRDRLETACNALGDAADGDRGIETADKLALWFGIGAPLETTDLTSANIDAYAESVKSEAVHRGKAATAALDAVHQADPVAELADIAHTLFDDGLPLVPPLVVAAGAGTDSFLSAMRTGAERADALARMNVRSWLIRYSMVRPALGRYTELMMLVDAMGRAPTLTGWQLSASPLDDWVGNPFPSAQGPPQQPVTGFVVDGDLDVAPAEPMALLVVDDWAEVVPHSADTRTIGLAVNANGPNARAQQALLLAVNPNDGAWTVAKLKAILDDVRKTIAERSRILEHLPRSPRILPALYVPDWSVEGEPVLPMADLLSNPDWTTLLSHVAERDGHG